MNPSKYALGVQEVEYHGHILLHSRWKMYPKKSRQDLIKNAKNPQEPKGLLGLTRCYLRFVNN